MISSIDHDTTYTLALRRGGHHDEEEAHEE